MANDRAQNTRARILQAASEEFDERGYMGASIQKIGDRAGATKGLVNYHFPSKAMMAKELVDVAFGDDQFVGANELPAELRGLRFLIKSCFDVAYAFEMDVNTRAAIRLQAEYRLIEADLPVPYLAWIDMIAIVMQQAVDSGEVYSDLNVRAEAWTLVASFAGLQNVSDRLTGRSDLQERVAWWLRRMVCGLGASNAEELVNAEVSRRKRQAIEVELVDSDR